MTSMELTGTDERADLIDTLSTHRGFLRHTVRDLTDAQAAQRTTVSALCLGGLIKHVTEVERNWTGFIVEGAPGLPSWDIEDISDRSDEFGMADTDTLAGLLAEYEEVAHRTDEIIRTLPDLNRPIPLPEAPWFQPGQTWTPRRALLHIHAETTQHAGHADIIRESLDGATTMSTANLPG